MGNHVFCVHNILYFQGGTSPGVFLNGVNNILLRANSNKSNATKYGISVKNQMMPATMKQDLTKAKFIGIAYTLIESFYIMIALTMTTSVVLIFYNGEKKSKSKLLTYLGGVNPATYWMVAFLWDILVCILVVGVLMVIFAIFKLGKYTNDGNAGHVFLLFFLFGWAQLSIVYLSTFVFRSSSTALIVLVFTGVLIGYIAATIHTLLDLSGKKEWKEAASIIDVIFLVLPQYCLEKGLLKIAVFAELSSELKKFKLEPIDSSLFTLVGRYYIALTVVGVICFLVVLLIDTKVFRRCQTLCSVNIEEEKLSEMTEDADVVRERTRVLKSKNSEGDILIVKNLRKSYRVSKCCKGTVAVRNVTFGVRSGTCFGLLGINGAGKTTTLRTLTGEIQQTRGEILIREDNAKKEKSFSRNLEMGYCPQVDFPTLLTPRELLTSYARIAHYPGTDIGPAVENLLDRLDLLDYGNTVCKNLSGGTNRRVAAAVALIGNHNLVLLDEPSSGLDPVSRRLLWNSIEQCTENGQGVVLVSHVMEECEALCDTIGILVNGRFVCLGSPQKLKNKFGNKYLITIDKSMVSGASEDLRLILKGKFPMAQRVEISGSALTFIVLLSEIPLSKIFQEMRSVQSVLKKGEEDNAGMPPYTISQISLNDVFVQFAERQVEEKV